MIALGMGNFLGSFFGAMPITASFGRSSVQSASGVKTPFANIYGGLYTLCQSYCITNKSSFKLFLIIRYPGSVSFSVSDAFASVYPKSGSFCCYHYVCYLHGGIRRVKTHVEKSK